LLLERLTLETINDFEILIANNDHHKYVEELCALYEDSAKKRGTGIAKREAAYLLKNIDEQKAIIAIRKKDGDLAGFCYIETWQGKDYVVNSGLIVKEDYRKLGLAFKIKQFSFDYTTKKYPQAKIFGITTSLPVMKMNSKLGYKPVTFSELTQDDTFWNGCKSCVNYDILTKTNKSNCLCTAMLYNPKDVKKKNYEIKKSVTKKVAAKQTGLKPKKQINKKKTK